MVDAAGIETDCRPLHFAAQLAPFLGTDCDFKNESSLSISFIFFSRHDFESKGCHQELPTVHLYMFIPGFPVCIEEDHHCLPLLDALFQKLWILRAFKIFLRTFWRHEPTPKPKCVCGQEILSCFHSFMDFRRLHCIPPITQLLLLPNGMAIPCLTTCLDARWWIHTLSTCRTCWTHDMLGTEPLVHVAKRVLKDLWFWTPGTFESKVGLGKIMAGHFTGLTRFNQQQDPTCQCCSDIFGSLFSKVVYSAVCFRELGKLVRPHPQQEKHVLAANWCWGCQILLEANVSRPRPWAEERNR